VARTDWNPVIGSELTEDYWADLQSFVTAERSRHEIYPPPEDVFAALHLTSYASTKVVIVGQDPYHGPGQAHGLCFSVRPGIAVPPSLRNVFSELSADLGIPIPDHGCLEDWARQGVLLLNTTLTVRRGEAGSHQGRGWERFTDRIITAVAAKSTMVVFVLWGGSARRKKALIAQADPHRRHHVVESAHPSPLSAHQGFMGSRPFSQINAALEASGQTPIDWRLGPAPAG